MGASYDAFAMVWTDTRTGVQELFFDSGSLVLSRTRVRIPIEVAEILGGVIQDGGGIIFVAGHIIRIPPWDPWIDVLHSLVAIDAAKQIRSAGATEAVAKLGQVIANVARHEIK